MKNFFNSENFLWQGFARLADYFIVSILWMVGCIPVVTAGTSCIALYDTVAHCIRFGEKDILRRFWNTYKAELRRGIAITLLWAVLSMVLSVPYQILAQMGEAGSIWNLLSIAYFVLLLLPVGAACWAIAIESRFTHSFAGLHRTALLFTIAHLPQTALISALFVVELNLLINFPFFAMFVPGLITSFQSHLIEKVFIKYTPSDADAVEEQTT